MHSDFSNLLLEMDGVKCLLQQKISSLTLENKNILLDLLLLGEMTGRNQMYTVENTMPDIDEDVEVRCGYGKCRPKLFGICNNSRIMLTVMSFYVFAQGLFIS